jgi:hypothetical protein
MARIGLNGILVEYDSRDRTQLPRFFGCSQSNLFKLEHRWPSYTPLGVYVLELSKVPRYSDSLHTHDCICFYR